MRPVGRGARLLYELREPGGSSAKGEGRLTCPMEHGGLPPHVFPWARTRALLFGVAALAFVLRRSSRSRRTGVAVDPNQVTGLTVTQNEGFATLAWTAGRRRHRLPDRAHPGRRRQRAHGRGRDRRRLAADPHGHARSPRFAEAGFALGGRYQWRVRARAGTATRRRTPTGLRHDAAPVGHRSGRRPAHRLGVERQRDVHDARAGDRVHERARRRERPLPLRRARPHEPDTGDGAPGNYPINMFILGYPSPPATAAAISNRPTILYNCNVHGNEPQGRESCFIFARMLSFTEDPHLLEILSNVTVLIVPSINGNGRAGNDRGNETDADLNRDHALLAPAGDARVREGAARLHARDGARPARGRQRGPADPHLAAPERLRAARSRGQGRARRGLDVRHRRGDRLVARPVPHRRRLERGHPAEHVRAQEHPRHAGREPRRRAATHGRPRARSSANRNRKSYGSLWEEFNTLEYFWTNMAKVRGIVADSIAYQRSNLGRIVLRGLLSVGPPPAVPRP